MLFWPPLEFFKIFFLFLKFFRNETFNIMFNFFFQIKSVIPSVTGQNHSKYLKFYVVKGHFSCLQPFFIFMCFFTISVTIAARHLKFSTRISPSIILTKQQFWSEKKCVLGVLRYGLGQKQTRLVILAT